MRLSCEPDGFDALTYSALATDSAYNSESTCAYGFQGARADLACNKALLNSSTDVTNSKADSYFWTKSIRSGMNGVKLRVFQDLTNQPNHCFIYFFFKKKSVD